MFGDRDDMLGSVYSLVRFYSILYYYCTVINSKQGIGFKIKLKHKTIDVSDSAVILKCVSDSYSTHD